MIICFFFFQSNVEAEQKSKCFVCDLPSYDFERKAKVMLIYTHLLSIFYIQLYYPFMLVGLQESCQV